MIFFWGAVLGFISVAFGAFAEHGLRETVSPEHFRFLMTAVRYNQIHAVAAIAIGIGLICSERLSNSSFVKLSGGLLIIGTSIFSFSIYLSVMFNLPNLVNFTPIGGITIMSGWGLLAIAALKIRQVANETNQKI